MQIKAEAGLSATSGVPTYSVSEDDRHVTWTITTKMLDEMAWWDELSHGERAKRVADGPRPKITADDGQQIELCDDFFGLHAVVARNALRTFLGSGGASGLQSSPRPRKWGDGLKPVPIAESASCHIFAEVADRGDGTGRIGRRVIISLGNPHSPYQWHFGPWMNDAEATALAAYLLPVSVPSEHPPTLPPPVIDVGTRP